MDKLVVSFISGVAVPLAVVLIGWLLTVVDRFGTDRIVSGIKSAAEALAALPEDSESTARVLRETIKVSTDRLRKRNHPRWWILWIALGIASVILIFVFVAPLLSRMGLNGAVDVTTFVASMVATVVALVSNYLARRTSSKLGDTETDFAATFSRDLHSDDSENPPSGPDPDSDR